MGAPGNDERKLESGGVAPAPSRSIHPAFYIAYASSSIVERGAVVKRELLTLAADYGLP